MSQYCRIGKKRLKIQGVVVETAAMDIGPCDGKCDMQPVFGYPAETCTRCGRKT